MSMKHVLAVAVALVTLGGWSASLSEARIFNREAVALAGHKKVTLEAKGGCAPQACAPKTCEPKVCEPVCTTPCLVYRHGGPKLCCGCDAPREIVLNVIDPCTGCEFDVPVCAPSCTEGEPTVCHGKGFLCRDRIDYEWCNGYRVSVVFRKHDVLVRTWGR